MKRLAPALGCLLLLAAAVLSGCAGASTSAAPSPSASAQKVIQVYAHRGARSFAPENSLPGYATALAIGADWVDMDVVMDKDREIVVSHDIRLNPDITRGPDGEFLAPDESALVKDLTYAQLRQYDVGRIDPRSDYAKYFPEQQGRDGVRMPLLRDVIRYVDGVTGGNVGFQIEFKTDPTHKDWTYTPKEFAAALYKVLEEEGISRDCEIQSFDWRCLYELQKLDPHVATAYLTEWDNEPGTEYSFSSPDESIAGLWTGGELVKDYNGSIPQMVKALGGRCWEPEDLELTKKALDEAHDLGLKVVVWTWPEHSGSAFDSRTVERMIAWGVDGIITDDPGRLTSMLAARGYEVPERYGLP